MERPGAMIPDRTLARWLPAPAVALYGDLIRGLAWAAVIVTWGFFAQVYARMWRLQQDEERRRPMASAESGAEAL